MTDERCIAVRRELEEGVGDASVAASVAGHVDACSSCRAHAALLRSLESLDAGLADEGRVEAILAALPPARWQRRRLAAWLPLAAAVALLVAGGLLIGEVPAAGLVGALPALSSGLLSWAGAWLLDARTAVAGGSDAVRALLAVEGAWLLALAVLTALGGGALVRSLARGRASDGGRS